MRSMLGREPGLDHAYFLMELETPSMSPASAQIELRTLAGQDLPGHVPRLTEFVAARRPQPLSRHPAWLLVLEEGLGHTPYLLEVIDNQKTSGILPLALVRSVIFGRFLVSLPYLNYGGVLTEDPSVQQLLVERAKTMADQFRARYLELRQERALEQSGLQPQPGAKVNMLLALPDDSEKLWKSLDAKVRNQVRKGQKAELTCAWGGLELLPEFYEVFSENMRDLGTPVFGRSLFQSILKHFPQEAEIGVVRRAAKAIASGLLLHGWGITEVPSASSLRAHNSTCANMLLYWQMLERTIQRRQCMFDFGRSSPDSSTYRFKKQWGAKPHPAVWHYYLREGAMNQMRPDNPRYRRTRSLWQKLPLWLSRLIGPWIVRGIP